ncbi:uncharacterized protein LOC133799749 [Humulus lupulus]|uniref:uncharacterized protein LOC133799749 n=1 Tax=Humulus lupulus TaxID=3486 RepID=UPI002B4093D1|nr:uncharacterized protein LOC133799749 [Humulus lupulus]
MEQAIEFEWLPTRCTCCKSLGHTVSSCKHAKEVVWKPKQQVTSSDKGDSRGDTDLCESGLENKSKDSNQLISDKDAQKTSKGAQLAVKGDPKSGMTASAAAVKEENQEEVSKKKLQENQQSNEGINKVEEMMKDIFLGWNWYSSRAVEGRILLVWKQDIVQVTITQEMDQLINCEVKIKGVNQTSYLSFVYGRKSVEERKNLSDQLHLPQVNIRPWLVVGDFNAVFEFDDRIGGRMVTALEVEDSRQWRAKTMLNELRSSGSFFTWSNKQKEGSRIFSKLDRVLINEMWLDIFPNSEARINWDTISDHCYCLIKTVQFQDSGIRPFRYYNMWATHKDFRSTVLNIWSKPTGGYAISSSSLLQQEEIKAATEYVRMSKLYESFLRQKRKINWLRFGDENTTYFHGSLKQRRMRNRITSFINDEGQIVENYSELGSVLSLEQQLMLIQPFTKKGVKRDLFSIHSIKSPGPDGFGSGFYKALWKDIREDISEAILMFFERGVIPAELNGTILSLIPKVDSPTKATYYRPIAYCNTLYKCISKMICFRLANVLPVIIHQNQGAFIKNRQLAHNILILQDILHGYTRKNISPRCVLKIDLSRAYDSIDWVFMEDILRAFCFPRRFIQWIMTCLTGTSYTLMFNGRLQGSFEGRKGLRQGDPISPLIFVLVKEYLTRLLKQASHQREFRFHPMCKHLQLVNLCFADDLILFCKGNFRSVQILFDRFLNFFHCFGLAANLSKSQIFFGGVAAEVKNDILKFVALGEGNFPMKYLGVCLPKVLGGLGFKEGFNWNKVLLAKYLWALSSKQDLLWVKWIDGVYLKGNSFWSYQLKPDVSWYWRKLCNLRETFTEMDLEAAVVLGNLKLKSLYSSMLQRYSVGFAKAVWCSLSVPKHRFILWQLVLGHLLTRNNLVWCRIDVSSKICLVWELLKHWLSPGIWPNQWDNWKQWLEGKPKNMMHRIYVASLAAAIAGSVEPKRSEQELLSL